MFDSIFKVSVLVLGFGFLFVYHSTLQHQLSKVEVCTQVGRYALNTQLNNFNLVDTQEGVIYSVVLGTEKNIVTHPIKNTMIVRDLQMDKR